MTVTTKLRLLGVSLVICVMGLAFSWPNELGILFCLVPIIIHGWPTKEELR